MTDDDAQSYCPPNRREILSGDASERFKALVLRWLKQRDREVEEVVSVETYGSDWAGGTEEGFYSAADTTITCRKPFGVLAHLTLEGSDLADLWHFIMREV